jgi:serine/threonine-protein kinase
VPHSPEIILPVRFELVCEIGRGGMAVVYRAHDRHLGRFVAIKVLSADLSNTLGAERFAREIGLMAKLVHPGIVALFDSGEVGGRLFYVMPLVIGETLRARLSREKHVAASDAAALGADIAEALAYAHGMGIVHRDVKPENIFAVGGRAVLTDFGIARMVGDGSLDAAQLTTAGIVVGTGAYMSPEQAAGDSDIDGRSDLYSLGCVLYELLTGTPPFVAPTLMATLAKHMTESPRPPSERGIALSAELEDVVLRLLAKNRADRPPATADVARMLRASSQARPTSSVTATHPVPSPQSASPAAVTVEFRNTDPEISPVASALGSAVASSLCTIRGLRVVVDEDGSRAAASTTTVAGRVRRSGSRLRVSVQVMGPDGALEWAHNADGTVDDPFALEDAIAETVLGHFTTRVRQATQSEPASQSARGSTGQTKPVGEVEHLVDQGVAAFNKFAPTGGAAAISQMHEAKAYLTRALAIEPENARALCALGNWYFVAGGSGIEPYAEAHARGRSLVYAALAADDHVAEVHCSMAKIALYNDDDFYAAARHVRRAEEIDPNEPEALRLHSIVYKILGRPDEAVNAARAATERMPDSAALWNALGDSLLAAGRNAEAVDALKRAISLLPAYGVAMERLELARTRLGELDLALELRISRMRLAKNTDRADLLESEAASLGAADAIRRDVRRELDALLKQAEASDPFQDNLRRNAGDRIVSGYAELGLWHEAMNWVLRGYEKRPGRLRRMLTDLPVDFRGLAVDPRYAKLMRVAGMEDLI